MAILINSAKGEGYLACCAGKPVHDNPYQSMETIYQWYEWLAGWDQAFNEHKFGVEA